MAAVPVPGVMSSLTSVVGGGPTFTGTAGAPAGDGSDTAPQGVPDAAPVAAVPGLDGWRVSPEVFEPPELPHAARASTDRSEVTARSREDRRLSTG